MIASDCTFYPHLGKFIRDLLHAVRHSTESLVYSDYPRETTTSTYLAIIFGPNASGVPWFIRPTAVPMQLPRTSVGRC